MTRDSISRVGRLILALLLAAATLPDCPARSGRPSAVEPAPEEGSDRSLAAENLAEQVAEIVHSSALSRTKKEKRISTAVRVAIVAATAYRNDPEANLGAAIELTEAAVRAAPQFAEVIANAIAFAPSLAHLDAAPGQIRAAAYAAAKNPAPSRRRNTAATRTGSPARTAAARPEARSVPAVANEEAEPGVRNSDYVADSAAPDRSSPGGTPSLSQDTKIGASAELSIRRDDNVYLTTANKVPDTIIAVTPGVDFRFGQNSLAHGGVSYKNAITRYVNKTAPNVALSNGRADFGYDSGSVALAANASYQQMNQNNSDVAALGQKAIYRRDVLGANANVEAHVTAKTSLATGANFSKSEYKTGGLTGDQQTEVPLKVYYEATPKVSVSTGFSYRRVTPQNGGESGRDLDYNVGARGNFTGKLSGQFSLDYRTRTVGSNARENLWGFNGSFDYELTPKVMSSLVLARDFNTGALGESLKTGSYALKVAADLTRQWQLGAGLTYRQVGYGPTVFSPNGTTTNSGRSDNYWEGNLQASYLFRSWLSASADYTIRNNHSTLPGAEFSNNLFSLMLGWRY